MSNLLTFVGGIVAIEASAFAVVTGAWKLGLWKLNRNIRKRGEG